MKQFSNPLMASLMPSCAKATEMLEKKQLVGLSTLESLGLRFHMAMCDACTAYARQRALLQQALDAELGQDKTPAAQPELAQKILSRLNNDGSSN